MEVLLANLAGSVRREEWHGRAYLVAPLTMIVPGVLNGSNGPLLYPAEEVSKTPDAWNGMPIVVGHPTMNGKPVSARSPKVLQQYQVGTVFNTLASGKLSAEGWFDEELTRRNAPALMDRLLKGEPIELSTGLFTDQEPVSGVTANGTPYQAIARNYRPDHLAVLLDTKGACSISDGCGVLVNKEKTDTPTEGGSVMKLTDNERKELVDSIINNSCGCWEAGDRETLNKMEDDRLKTLSANAKKVKGHELTANAAGKGISDKEGNQYTFNAETGKWDVKPAEKPAATATAPTNNDGAKSPAKPQTVDEWFKAAPPEVQSAVQNAMRIEQEERRRIVGLLTGNIAHADSKKAAEAVYNSMKMDDLRALAATVPQPQSVPASPVPLYYGQAGAPTNVTNSSNDVSEDILPLPTMNWKEEKATA